MLKHNNSNKRSAKMSKNSDNKTEKKSFSNYIIISVSVIAILSIISITCFAWYNIFYTKNNNSNLNNTTSNTNTNNLNIEHSSQEIVGIDTIITFGLSTIAIAIAVWAALNIINSINQSDINKLISKTAKLEGNIPIIESFLDNSIPKLEKSIDNYNSFQSNQFIQILERFSNDPIIKNIISLYNNESKENINSYISFETLTQIELRFSRVYKLHKSEYNYDPILIDNAEQSLELIKILKPTDDSLSLYLKLYLEYRQADFNFYAGYCAKNKLHSARYFNEAKKGYFKLAQSLGIDFNNIQNQDNLQIAYLANSIGESYSKIVQYYSDDKQKLLEFKNTISYYAQEAIRYCKIATYIIDTANNKKDASMFYRNLGCALERRDRVTDYNNFENHNEIISAYKTSFWSIWGNFTSSQETIKNAYFTLLSYYRKYIWHLQGWPDKNYDKITINYDNINIEKINYVITHINDMYYVSKIAAKDFKHSSVMPVFYGLSCCFIIIAKENNISLYNYPNINHKTKDYFILEIESVIELLQPIIKNNNVEKNYTMDNIKFVSYIYDIMIQLYTNLK